MFPIQNVHLLLKAYDAAFRSEDRENYNATRANLRKWILQLQLSLPALCLLPLCQCQSTPLATALSDFHPIALTHVIAKRFERLVLTHLKACLPPALDTTQDTISTLLHSALTHLENPNTYARMLFFYFSSDFNTVSPSKLVLKLTAWHQNTTL